MNTAEYFREENRKLLFDCIGHEEEYIACACENYSEYHSCDSYSRTWAFQFESGRYVITVYQRYAVYKNGVEVYVNGSVTNGSGAYGRRTAYCLISEKEFAYDVPSWKRKLTSHSIRTETNPLQTKYYTSLGDARTAAIKYSSDGNAVAVVRFVDEYDMY